MRDFDYWKRLFESDNLDEFNSDTSGLLWLKLKSIVRKELLQAFLLKNGLFLSSKGLNSQFSELYEKIAQEPNRFHKALDSFIREKCIEQQQEMNTEQLVSELYKLKHFDWGGDYKNALDKYLVDRFIKVHQSFETLMSKFDTDINRAVQGYVLCSWYNHWSSILIEHIFKTHSAVLPTVGQVKKVDFFINNIPFGLKVTYLPANFIESRRKEYGLKPELTELKQKAKNAGIIFSTHRKADDTYYEIVEKLKDRGTDFCLDALQQIKSVRLQILQEAIDNPQILAKNLYEEQGEMRFDSSNRLFLVLVDRNDFDSSWKLKRNLDLLRPGILSYLDTFSQKNIEDLRINFTYKNRTQQYTALTDVLFVMK